MAVIRDVGARPLGDDQQWKKEVERVITALIAKVAAQDSQIAALKARVK